MLSQQDSQFRSLTTRSIVLPLFILALLSNMACERKPTPEEKMANWEPRIAGSKGDLQPLLLGLPLGQVKSLSGSQEEGSVAELHSADSRLPFLGTGATGATHWARAVYENETGFFGGAYLALHPSLIEHSEVGALNVNVVGAHSIDGAPVGVKAMRLDDVLPDNNPCRIYWTQPDGAPTGPFHLLLRGIKGNSLLEVAVPGVPPAAAAQAEGDSFSSIPLWKSSALARLADVYKKLDLDFCGTLPPSGMSLSTPSRTGIDGLNRAIAEAALAEEGFELSTFDDSARYAPEFKLAFIHHETGATIGVESHIFDDGQHDGHYEVYSVNEERIIAVRDGSKTNGEVDAYRDALVAENPQSLEAFDQAVVQLGYELLVPAASDTECQRGLCAYSGLTSTRGEFQLYLFAPPDGADGHSTVARVEGRRVLVVYTVENAKPELPNRILRRLAGAAAAPASTRAQRLPKAVDVAAFDRAMAAGRKATVAKEYPVAEKAFCDAISEDPVNARAHSERGYARLLAKQWVAAEEDFKTARRLTQDKKLLKQIAFNERVLSQKRGKSRGPDSSMNEKSATPSLPPSCHLKRVPDSKLTRPLAAESFPQALILLEKAHRERDRFSDGKLTTSVLHSKGAGGPQRLNDLLSGKAPTQDGVWLFETSRGGSVTTTHLLFSAKGQLELYAALGVRNEGFSFQGDEEARYVEVTGRPYFVITFTTLESIRMSRAIDPETGGEASPSTKNPIRTNFLSVESVGQRHLAFDERSFRFLGEVQAELRMSPGGDLLPDKAPFVGQYGHSAIGIGSIGDRGCGGTVKATW